MEVGRRMSALRRTLYLGGRPEEVDALEVFETLVNQRNDLRDYAARSSYWLDCRIFQQVLLINERLDAFLSGWLERPRKHGGPAIDTEAVKEFDKEITPLHEELGRKIETYLGTHRWWEFWR